MVSFFFSYVASVVGVNRPSVVMTGCPCLHLAKLVVGRMLLEGAGGHQEGFHGEARVCGRGGRLGKGVEGSVVV